MKKHIFGGLTLLVLLSVNLKSIYAQDPEFSQSYANPLYLNPAFAGTGSSQRIGLNFRDQWPGLSGNPITYNISYDRNIIDTNDAIGLLANMDKAGAITTDNISLIYAHQFHIKSFTLSAGAQATFRYLSIEQSQLYFGPANPIRGFIYLVAPTVLRTNVSMPDFSAGVLGYGKNYFVGFSADHLTQPNESFIEGTSPLPVKYTANAGVMIPVGTVVISPTILYEEQDNANQTVVECYLSAWYITVGIGYRFQDAMIFMLGYQGKLLRIGYSYDYTTSTLTNTLSGGAHEVSLAVLLPYKSAKLKKINGINCLAF